MTGSPPAPDENRWQTTPGEADRRFDQLLAERLGLARNRVQRLLADGQVTLDGVVVRRASTRVQPGQHVHVQLPDPEPSSLVPEAEPLQIEYEDEHLLVLDKPAGLVVHPGAGNRDGTLCHRLLHHAPEIADVGHPERPGIVHRLDAGTSGVMVVAKTASAYERLARAFAERRTEKHYLAVVHGVPRPAHRVIEEPIARDLHDRKRWTVAPGGRASRTDFSLLDEASRLAALHVRLHTGRTHQIRVHLKHVRHPLVGDPVYGEARWKEVPASRRKVVRTFPRPALHAWVLGLEHPETGAVHRFAVRPPADLQELWSFVAERSLPDAPRDG